MPERRNREVEIDRLRISPRGRKERPRLMPEKGSGVIRTMPLEGMVC
jgi:hypothetical protein